MPFSDILTEAERCKEHECKINNKNIKKIFKPDNGFIDKAVEKLIFPRNGYKICDCIIVCNNDNIFVVEILCGALSYSEYKEKIEQIENCCKVIKHKGQEHKVQKIILLYKTLDKKIPAFKKKLLNPPKMCNTTLMILQNPNMEITC